MLAFCEDNVQIARKINGMIDEPRGPGTPVTRCLCDGDNRETARTPKFETWRASSVLHSSTSNRMLRPRKERMVSGTAESFWIFSAVVLSLTIVGLLLHSAWANLPKNDEGLVNSKVGKLTEFKGGRERVRRDTKRGSEECDTAQMMLDDVLCRE